LFNLQAKIVGGASSHIASVDTHRDALNKAVEYALHWIETHRNDRGFGPMKYMWQGGNALVVYSNVEIPTSRSSSMQTRTWLVVTIHETWADTSDKLSDQFPVDIPSPVEE
jgi:hypothetical protein